MGRCQFPFRLLVCLLLCSGCIDIYVEAIPEESPGPASTADLAALDVQGFEEENEADIILLEVEEDTFIATDLEGLSEGSEEIVEHDLSRVQDSDFPDTEAEVEEDIRVDAMTPDLSEAGDFAEADEGGGGSEDRTLSCATPSDCAPNGWCVEGECARFTSFPPCEDAEADCEEGEICIHNYCVPLFSGDVTCEEDEDCAHIGVVCLEGACTHIDCVASSDCPEGTVCSEDICVAVCAEDEDCPGASICVENECVSPTGCILDEDCSEGEICIDAECVPDIG